MGSKDVRVLCRQQIVRCYSQPYADQLIDAAACNKPWLGSIAKLDSSVTIAGKAYLKETVTTRMTPDVEEKSLTRVRRGETAC